MSTLIQNARVLTLDDQLSEIERADIFVRGSKIESIGPDLPVPEHSPRPESVTGFNCGSGREQEGSKRQLLAKADFE